MSHLLQCTCIIMYYIFKVEIITDISLILPDILCVGI